MKKNTFFKKAILIISWLAGERKTIKLIFDEGRDFYKKAKEAYNGDKKISPSESRELMKEMLEVLNPLIDLWESKKTK